MLEICGERKEKEDMGMNILLIVLVVLALIAAGSIGKWAGEEI